MTARTPAPAPTSAGTHPYQVLLYYRFVRVPDPELMRREQDYLCRRLQLKGRILVAPEGINGTVSGTAANTECYMQFMRKHPLFGGLEFKVDGHEGHTFHKLHVRVKKELVALGVDEPYDPIHDTGSYIEPQDMQRLLRDTPQDVVILDTRSNFEYEVGRFKGAVHLDIDRFRDLPEHMDQLEALRGKTLVTYCTGGIRCEKVTSWLLQKGFTRDKLLQLHGGIIRYGHETGGADFEGQCYVFDERIVVPVNQVNPTVVARCHRCGSPSERMVNCANAACNAQIVLCTDCGWQHHGTCSEACLAHPQRRVYDGSGQYHRGVNSKQYVQAPSAQ